MHNENHFTEKNFDFVRIPFTKLSVLIHVSDFNQDGKADNITFMIKRIKVHSMDALKDPLYRFPNNYGVEKFLELFSGEYENERNNTCY